MFIQQNYNKGSVINQGIAKPAAIKGNVLLELWKDADGVRLEFSRENESFACDLSYESVAKLITALDEYISDDPDGSYKAYYFEVSDDE